MRGFARRSVLHPKKVLIIQLAKLGDMVCVTPVFRAIKKQYPTAEVWVIGNTINRELLAGHPDVDRYIPLSKEALLSSEKMRELARLIRRERFDFACMTSPQFELLALLYRVGVPCIAVPRIVGGWTPYETRPFKILRRLVATIPHRMGSYAPREYLRLLEPLGIHETDTTKRLVHSSHAHEAVTLFLKEQGVVATDFVIGVAPSVGNKVKIWGSKKFAEVIEHLQAQPGTKIVVVGGAIDKEEVDATLSQLSSHASVINACEKFSLEELKAAIASMNLFVSVDTGPIYIAEAYGVPTVDILGPMDEREQPPREGVHRVVYAERRAAELHIMNARIFNSVEARRQTDAISVAMVTGTIEKLCLEIRGK